MYASFTDPRLIESLKEKGICKFIAYELPPDRHQSDELRIVDFNGGRAFRLLHLDGAWDAGDGRGRQLNIGAGEDLVSFRRWRPSPLAPRTPIVISGLLAAKVPLAGLLPFERRLSAECSAPSSRRSANA